MRNKKLKKIKTLSVLLLLIIQIISFLFMTYLIIIYKNVEAFYRVSLLLVFIYIFLFLSYMLLRSIKKKTLKSFLVPAVIAILITILQFIFYYYLTKIYNSFNEFSNNENIYYSYLVTYNKKLKTYKDLNKNTIGIISSTNDIEGNILPEDTIKKLNLDKNNTIKKYDSTMELLNNLKSKKIDAAFFTRNYVEMFSTIEGYENIEKETNVLYVAQKEYKSKEENIKSNTASLTKPFAMLLIGVDSSKDGVTSGYNADVQLLITFNPSTLRATITSVPRDMYLKTACSAGKYRRINTVTWGSTSTCAVQTIEKLFDVDIDYFAKINFKGIVQLVDAVGGIDVDVPYSFCEQNSSRAWGNKTVYLKQGKQHINGEQALALSRNRHYPNDGSATGKAMGQYCPNDKNGDRSDYTRGKNQMKVILGIVKAATNLKNPNQAIEILEKIKANFQTNIKTNDVLELYDLGKSIILNDSSNLINIQRMQLKGFSQKIYDSSLGYPSITIPYNGSINDIKKEIKVNLSQNVQNSIKTASFDIEKPFKDTVIGQKNYSANKLPTLANVSSYTVEKLKSYASSNNLKLKFIDIDTNKEININSYSDYKFVSQKEHVDTIINQLKELTIYIKKIQVLPQTNTDDTNTNDGNTNSTNDDETNNNSNNNSDDTNPNNTND